MPLVVVAVGRVKESGLRDAVDDYYARIRRFVPLDEHEVRDGVVDKVAVSMLRGVPSGAHLVGLEIAGRGYSSDAFARWLEGHLRSGKGVVAFAIGGADGLPPAVRAAAAEELSLSPFTLPHRLARLVLAEQLYRAMTILRGAPYPR